MSLILDALNKADNERSKDAPPSLTSEHDMHGNQQHSKTHQKLIVLLALVVCALLIFVAYLVLKGDNTAHTPPGAANAINATRSDASPSRSAPAPANSGQQTDSASDTYQAMRQKLIDAQYEQATSQSEESKSQPAKPSTDTRSLVADIYDDNEAKEPEPKAPPKNIAPKQVVKPKLISSTKTLNDYPTLSFIGDLSHSTQKSIPTLMYREHVVDGPSSFVTLNSNKRQKGQLVAEGIYLEEILPDGIVLRFGSEKFKMKALNSWVNM